MDDSCMKILYVFYNESSWLGDDLISPTHLNHDQVLMHNIFKSLKQ